MTPRPPAPSRFRIPEWLIGPADLVERRVKTVAKHWASRYGESGSFPEFELVDSGSQDLLLFGSSDHLPARAAARLFANRNLTPQIQEALGYRDMAKVRADYERHVGGTAWGSFENLLFAFEPNDLEALRRRCAMVLPHLEALEGVTVVDQDDTRRSAAAVLDRQYTPTLAHWGAVQGDLGERIRTALKVMEVTPPEALRDRLVRAMIALVPSASRLRHRDALTEDAVRRYLGELDPRDYERLTGCFQGDLLGELYAMDRDWVGARR